MKYPPTHYPIGSIYTLYGNDIINRSFAPNYNIDIGGKSE